MLAASPSAPNAPDSSPETVLPLAPALSWDLAGPPFDSRRATIVSASTFEKDADVSREDVRPRTHGRRRRRSGPSRRSVRTELPQRVTIQFETGGVGGTSCTLQGAPISGCNSTMPLVKV